MRLLRLDLSAFGPFSDVSLDLSGGCEGLHLIYGMNEAGKSSALRALRQFLFGIEDRTQDDFIHDKPDLRIGAAVRDNDGREYVLTRRKGRRQTLLGYDGVPVEDDLLDRMLTGVSERQFSTLFGIDHAALVQGGEELAHGGGDVGLSLFAAGMGTSNLRDVLAKLEREAEQLYAPHGKTRQINLSLVELREKARAIKDSALRSSTWVEHRCALDETMEAKRVVMGELSRQAAEQSRLKRIQQALPLIGRRGDLILDLAPLTCVAILPIEFPQRRTAAQEALRGARCASDDADDALRQTREKVDAIVVPESLLRQAELIEELNRGLGDYRKARSDRIALAARQHQLETEARELLQELRPGAEIEQIEQLRLSVDQRARIQALGHERQAVLERADSADASVESISRRLGETAQQLDCLPAPPDTSELNDAIRRTQQNGDLEQQFVEIQNALRRAEGQAETHLKALPLWSGAPGVLESLPVPSFETVERFDKELNDSAKLLEKECAAVEMVDTSLADLDKEIEQLRVAGSLVEDDLHAIRRRRDEGWQHVRRAWQGQDEQVGARAFASEFDPQVRLAEAYENAVRRADDVADRLRREADRVAVLVEKVGARQVRARQRGQLHELVQQAQLAHANKVRDWTTVWARTGIDPLSPHEMRAWLLARVSVVKEYESCRELRTRMESIEANWSARRDELTRQLLRLCESGSDLADSVSELRAHAEAIATRITVQRDLYAKLLDRMKELNSDRGAALAQQKSAREACSRWESAWALAVAPLRLSSGALPAEADAIVEKAQDLFKTTRSRDELRGRIAGIDADAEHFAAQVTALLGHVAPDLCDVQPEQAVADLHARLTRAREDAARCKELQKQLTDHQSARNSNRGTITTKADELAAMCREACVESPEDLPEAERRSNRARELRQSLTSIGEHLAQFAAGAPLETFVTEARAEPADTLDERIHLLENEIRQREERRSALDQTIGSEQTELSRMDGTSRAAELAGEAQSLLAGIASGSEQYVRLRLAAAVLERGIERYRAKNQAPVLRRAAEIFGELTMQSFMGLEADDDDGKPLLRGVRANRQTLTTQQMSTGTRDQLYLALRLATVEGFVERGMKLPFIVDDILINFDDDRAAASLRVLADLSRRTQVIFFTHHRHLMELARQTLDESVLSVRTLAPPAVAVS